MANSEGCYIVESSFPVEKEGHLCFDATRRFDQLGRYINHAQRPNAKVTRPFKIAPSRSVRFMFFATGNVHVAAPGCIGQIYFINSITMTTFLLLVYCLNVIWFLTDCAPPPRFILRTPPSYCPLFISYEPVLPSFSLSLPPWTWTNVSSLSFLLSVFRICLSIIIIYISHSDCISHSDTISHSDSVFYYLLLNPLVSLVSAASQTPAVTITESQCSYEII